MNQQIEKGLWEEFEQEISKIKEFDISKLKLTEEDNSVLDLFFKKYLNPEEQFPSGERHSVIEKNFAIYIIKNKLNLHEIKKAYQSKGFKIQSLKSQINGVLRGTYGEQPHVSIGELVNWSKRNRPDLIEMFQEASELNQEREKGFVWLTSQFWDKYDWVKGKTKKKLGHKSNLITEKVDWVFYAHDKDIITGKPQLIERVQKKIPLIRQTIKKVKDKETKEEIPIQSFVYFDERFDKRYDGYQRDSYAEDFWMYRIITEEGKEYYLLSKHQLSNVTCVFKGMAVEMDDFAEMSRSMRIKSLSRLFFVKDFEPNVKILSKEDLIKLVESKGITLKRWKEFLAFHPNGNLNRFPVEAENLRSAFILSSKVDGYPLHLLIMGTAGTRKSMGYIETTAYKISEEAQICEGANSRIKGLTPSFKERPANIGYLAKQERIGFIDEVGKMVEFENNKHQSGINNVLGELNVLLDHKKRVVGSGNDNDVVFQATAKFMFVTNPVGGRTTLHDHIGLIDPTTLSRMFLWVQDYNERSFVLGKEGIVPPTPTQDYLNNRVIENRKKEVVLKMCWGELGRDEFLTLYDTCNSFLSEIDDLKVEKLANDITSIAKDMKGVWEPRDKHHVKLLIDGLVKQRCLFEDYDSSFTAIDKDYDLAEKILIRMAEGWKTKFNKTYDNPFNKGGQR